MTSSKHLILSAQVNAQKEALSLVAWASTIFPTDNHALLDLATQQILDSGLIFAINARKFMELNKLKDCRITAARWNYKLKDGLEVEDSFRRAINAIIHSHTNQLNLSKAPQKVFADSKKNDAIFLHFVAATDRYPNIHIDIFGLAWTFLSIINRSSPE